MSPKVKIAIAVGVLIVGGVAYARSRKRLTCGQGSTFKAVSKSSDAYVNGSAALRAQIDKYGGYCVRQGTVTFDNGSANAPDVSTAPDYSDTDKDAQDSVLITHPWQLV